METRICVLGASLDTGNLGVSALSVSLLGLLSGRHDSVHVSLLSPGCASGERSVRVGAATYPVSAVPYRLAPTARPWDNIAVVLGLLLIGRLFRWRAPGSVLARRSPFVQAVREARFVGDIWGGDSFTDLYGLGRLLLGSIPRLAVIAMGKSLVLLPQTYGPYTNVIARRLSRLILRHALVVYARDRRSMETAMAIARGRKYREKFRFCPDVAFCLVPTRGRAEVPEKPHNSGTLPVGINVSGLLYSLSRQRGIRLQLALDYPKFCRDLIVAIVGDARRPVWLIPHVRAANSREDDATACREVFRSLPEGVEGNVWLCDQVLSESEVKWVIGRTGFFVGARMHSCIASVSQGVPTAAIAYSDKFVGVFESIGLGAIVVDARVQKCATAIDSITRQVQGVGVPVLDATGIAAIRTSIQDVFAGLAGE